RRAIQQFKLTLLLPLIALFACVLVPVLLLQLYFSFHQWTVYLGSWWDADFVGLEMFQSVFTDPRFGWAVVRSLAFPTGSTLRAGPDDRLLPRRLRPRLPDAQAVPRPRGLLHHLHPADAHRAGRRLLHGRDDALQQRPGERHHLGAHRRELPGRLADRPEHRA